MRTQEQRDEQTLVITSTVLRCALLLLAVLSLATARVGSVPMYVVLAAASLVAVVAVVARPLARRRR